METTIMENWGYLKFFYLTGFTLRRLAVDCLWFRVLRLAVAI